MSNPLEDEVWAQVQEAYKIVDTGQIDSVEVDSPVHSISVFREKLENAIIIKVVY